MISLRRKSTSYLIFLAGVAFLSWAHARPVFADVLTPGDISGCGEMAAGGVYSLTQDINVGSTTPCFVISSNDVSIYPNGHSITGNITVKDNGGGSASWSGDDSTWAGQRTWTFGNLGNTNDYSSNYGVISGDATFNGSSGSNGTVFGNATFNDYSDAFGTITGNATFGSASYLGNATVYGNAIFNDSAAASVSAGYIYGNATFNGSSYNNCYNLVVYGNTTFNDSSYSSGNLSSTGNVTFNGSSNNSGPLASYGIVTFNGSSFNSYVGGYINAIFNNSSHNDGNVGEATFNDSSFNNTSGAVNDSATFNGSSSNLGTVSGSALFNGSSINGSSAYVNGNATFSDSSSNHGTVYGIATFTGNAYNYNTVNNTCIFSDLSHNLGTCYSTEQITYWNSLNGSQDWNDISNWWQDASSTIQADSIGGYSVVLEGNVSPILNLDTTLAPSIIDSSQLAVGGYTLIVDSGSGNYLNGVTVYGNVTFQGSAANNSSVIGDAIFKDSSINNSNGYIYGDATFNNSSYNNSGIIYSNATFNDTTSNYGVVNGTATFNDSAYNESSLNSAVFNGSSYNDWGWIYGNAIFNDSSSNGYQIVGNAIFNASSTNGSYSHGSSAYVAGNATFNGSSVNIATVNGQATFNNSSYSIGSLNGNVIFTASSFDSNTIPGTNPQQGGVGGYVIFSSPTPVTFTLRNGDYWYGDTSSWKFASGTPTWIFNDTTYGSGSYLAGNAIFNDASNNWGLSILGTVTNNCMANGGSGNAGTIDHTGSQTCTPVYWYSTGSQDINDASNWWSDQDHTIQAVDVPQPYNKAVLLGSVAPIINLDTNYYYSNFIDTNGLTGTASSTGVVFTSTGYQQTTSSGSITGNATFEGKAINSFTSISNDANFYDDSRNGSTVNGNAYFYERSMNNTTDINGLSGSVLGICNFYDTALNGTGSCGSAVAHYLFYFNNAVSTNWNNVGNWWYDAGFTTHAVNVSGTQITPQTGDVVYIDNQLTTGPASPISLGKVYIASSTQGSVNNGNWSANLTNINSNDVYVWPNATLTGNISGNLHIFGNRTISQVVGGSTVTNVEFNDTTSNDATVNGNVTFNGTNQSNSGTITGNVTVATSTTLSGTGNIEGNLTNSGTYSNAGTITGNTTNTGTISSGTFVGTVTNIAGTIAGAVTNLVTMIFNSGGHVSSLGSLTGDALFNSTAYNQGIIAGTSTFNGTAYNVGTTTNATFAGDLAENFHLTSRGVVTDAKTRLYNALNPQTNLLRNFVIDGPWTVNADSVFVNLAYAVIDLFTSNSATHTTLATQNGGFILAPLDPSQPVTSCGVLDQAGATYILATSTNITGYKYNPCFIVRANNITLDGNFKTISAISNATSTAILTTASSTIDATTSAFTGLTVKNLKLANFAVAIDARGANNTSGNGGNGGTITIATSTLRASILADGGNGTANGGNGGTVTMTNTSVAGVVASSTVSANGGNATSCGNGGNAGFIHATSSRYDNLSTLAGSGNNSGCSNTQVNAGSTSGQHQTTSGGNTASLDPVSDAIQAAADAIAAAEAAAQAAAEEAARLAALQAQAPRAASGGREVQQAPGLTNIEKVLPQVISLVPVKFAPLPSFGDSNDKNNFSFSALLSNFFDAPLPAELTAKLAVSPKLAAYLNTAGLKTAQDLVNTKNNPLALPEATTTIPGLFTISMPTLPVRNEAGDFINQDALVKTVLITPDAKNIAQVVRVQPGSQFTVHLTPVTKTPTETINFNGKSIKLTNGIVNLTAPKTPGKYKVTSLDSPLILLVQVVAPPQPPSLIITTGQNSVTIIEQVATKVTTWISRVFSFWKR